MELYQRGEPIYSYLSHLAYFYLYTQIVADSCEWLISYADKYVLLRLLRSMMKLLATAPLEQESEFSTIVFLVPDDVLKMPLTYWLAIGTKRISGERICRKDLMF